MDHAALDLFDDHALGLERGLENRDRQFGLRVAAHEDVEAAKPFSGQVWQEMWLSLSTATPEMPPFGSNTCVWMCSSVAPAALMASRKA